MFRNDWRVNWDGYSAGVDRGTDLDVAPPIVLASLAIASPVSMGRCDGRPLFFAKVGEDCERACDIPLLDVVEWPRRLKEGERPTVCARECVKSWALDLS